MGSFCISKGKLLIYVVIGLLMSGLSTQVCEKIGIPTIPELVYLPLILIVSKDYTVRSKWKNHFVVFSVVWFFVLICALFNGQFGLSPVLSTARAYLLLGLFLTLFFNISNTEKLLQAVFITSFSSVVGWALTVYLKFAGVFPMGLDFVTYGNMVTVSLAISFAFTKYRRPVILLPLLAIVIFISVASATRRLILVSVMSIIISFLLNSIFVKKSFKSTIVLAFITISFISILPAIESSVEDISPVLHHRIFDKTRDAAFDSDIKEDNVREDNFSKIANDIPNLILPHGFVSKQAIEDGSRVGIFIDNPFYEVFYTIGLPAGVVLLLVLLIRIKGFFVNCIKYKNPDIVTWFTPSLICFMLLFIDSTYLSWSYITPSTGAVVGMLFKYGKKRLRKNEDFIFLPGATR